MLTGDPKQNKPFYNGRRGSSFCGHVESFYVVLVESENVTDNRFDPLRGEYKQNWKKNNRLIFVFLSLSLLSSRCQENYKLWPVIQIFK